jgi:hypothetical protein
LWLKDAKPSELKLMPLVSQRVEQIRAFRLESTAKTTRDYAAYPTLFRQISQPDENYILVPRHTSENRKYIPFAYFEPNVIVSDACFFVPSVSPYHFGVISSNIHMAWVRQFCGRIKSDYRYSKDIVYNNYPWPQNPTEKQKANVEAKAQAVLDARAKYPDSSLADLYDPLTMPPDLVKAHEQLDKAVEQCYRSKPFEADRERVEYLFQLYEQLTAPLTAQADKPKRTRKKKTDDGE